MPVMDGLTATKAIRQIEQSAKKKKKKKKKKRTESEESGDQLMVGCSNNNNNTSLLSSSSSSLSSTCNGCRKKPFRYHRHRHGHTPIIGVTASISDEDKAICLSAGMDGFVEKPIRKDLLLRVLGGQLSSSSSKPATSSTSTTNQQCPHSNL